MTTVTIHKAKTQLSKLIEQAETGEEVIIARGKTPVALLVPYAPEQPKQGFGSMRGRVWLDESFWEPLPEEELKLFEGGQLLEAAARHPWNSEGGSWREEVSDGRGRGARRG